MILRDCNCVKTFRNGTELRLKHHFSVTSGLETLSSYESKTERFNTETTPENPCSSICLFEKKDRECSRVLSFFFFFSGTDDRWAPKLTYPHHQGEFYPIRDWVRKLLVLNIFRDPGWTPGRWSMSSKINLPSSSGIVSSPFKIGLKTSQSRLLFNPKMHEILKNQGFSSILVG